jgi:Spy/CpxP family protein refolding chaperone
MKVSRAALLALLLAPCLAAAQGPPHPPDLGKWWKNSDIARELQLSDAQTSQIEQTFLEQRLKLIDLRAELEKQEARLQPLIEADQPDEAKVSAQIDQVLAARGRLEKANALMMLSIRRVLTVEQWKKLQGIQQEHERMERRRMGRLNGPPPGAAPPPRPPEEDR